MEQLLNRLRVKTKKATQPFARRHHLLQSDVCLKECHPLKIL